MGTTVSPLMLTENERDHIVFAVAHGLALLEVAPAHWGRPEATLRLTEVLDRLDPRKPKRGREHVAAEPLLMARKHISALRKMK